MPAIIVLGGHRTGTSVTARLVHELGFPAAPSPERLLKPRAGRECDNPDGYFEDVAFVRLHRRMLGENVRSVGGWTNPRRDDAVVGALRDRYRALVRDRNLHSRDWSLKDPRLCLIGDVLLESLLDVGIDARIITTTRSESQVVASLVRRRISAADAERIAAMFEAGRQAVLHLARGIPCLELSLAFAASRAEVERQIQRLQTFLGRPDEVRTRSLADLVRHAR